MKLIEINWHPTARQLRQFGAIRLFALPGIGWLWGSSNTAIVTLGAIGVMLAGAGLVMPKLLKPIYVAMTVLTTPIGMVIGEVAMLFIYFCVFLPFGLLFRLARRDSLQLKLDRNRKTYWQGKTKPAKVASYYRQS